MDQKLRCQLNRISSKEVQVRRLYEGSRLAYIFFSQHEDPSFFPTLFMAFLIGIHGLPAIQPSSG